MKTMGRKSVRLMVSKAFVKEMQKRIPAEYHAEYLEMSCDEYEWSYERVWNHTDDIIRYTDNSIFGNPVLKIIKITYPPEFYCMPCYLSSADLEDIYSRAEKFQMNFWEALIGEIAV